MKTIPAKKSHPRKRTMDSVCNSNRSENLPMPANLPGNAKKETYGEKGDFSHHSPSISFIQPSAKNNFTNQKISLLIIFSLIFLGGTSYLIKNSFPKNNSQKESDLVEKAETVRTPIETQIRPKTPTEEKIADENINTEPKDEEEGKRNDITIGPVQVSGPMQNENDFSFAILGDTQRFDAADPKGGFQQSIASIGNKNPSLIVAVGDLLSSCDGLEKCENDLSDWKNIVGQLFPKTYAVMGNHDRTGKGKADTMWQKFFTLPQNGPAGYRELVYSFDFKDSHFIILNSEKPEENLINKTQRNWLEADLAKNAKKHVFVFFHEPAYPVKSKIDESLDANAKERDQLWKILEKYKVDAVFSGHEHIQSHKKIGSIDQFIFGNTDSFDHEIPPSNSNDFYYQGQGFGMVSVSDSSTKVEFFTVSGK
ncbi:MAG TPA: hypothetical protein DIC35_04380, partial [Candidatus Moranbacteria bacterium]|nr:hypothetical protein [Candidatus Moranbacteria bacterium]